LAGVLGLALGFGLAVSYLPGGYDALHFFLKAPDANATVPAWVYLITYPLGRLPWPAGWMLLTFATVLVVGVTGLAWGNRRWWLALVTPPLLWTVWLGQIEGFHVAGLLVTGLVLQKKLPPAWLGVSWLLLLTKPQVGLGALALQALWLWRERPPLRRLWPAPVIFIAVFALTVLLWPSWITNWLGAMRAFAPDYWNAAIWPVGLLAWPVALLAYPRAAERQRARMFLAAGLLGSPYFAMYHCLTLLTVTETLWALPLAWGVLLIGLGTPEVWQRWSWILPVGLLVVDAVALALAARRTAPVAVEA
jgi:hypothetical protein